MHHQKSTRFESGQQRWHRKRGRFPWGRCETLRCYLADALGLVVTDCVIVGSSWKAWCRHGWPLGIVHPSCTSARRLPSVEKDMADVEEIHDVWQSFDRTSCPLWISTETVKVSTRHSRRPEDDLDRCDPW